MRVLRKFFPVKLTTPPQKLSSHTIDEYRGRSFMAVDKLVEAMLSVADRGSATYALAVHSSFLGSTVVERLVVGEFTSAGCSWTPGVLIFSHPPLLIGRQLEQCSPDKRHNYGNDRCHYTSNDWSFG